MPQIPEARVMAVMAVMAVSFVSKITAGNFDLSIAFMVFFLTLHPEINGFSIFISSFAFCWNGQDATVSGSGEPRRGGRACWLWLQMDSRIQ